MFLHFWEKRIILVFLMKFLVISDIALTMSHVDTLPFINILFLVLFYANSFSSNLISKQKANCIFYHEKSTHPTLLLYQERFWEILTIVKY